MASPQVGSLPAKLSFAKVAAMRAPAVPSANPNPPEERKPAPIDGHNVRTFAQGNIPMPSSLSGRSNELPPRSREGRIQSDYVTNAIQGLSLVKDGSSSPTGPQSAESRESLEDDQSHLSNSSTKQQSFDTKSMASVTTFAMDEKESIRPDDSASVRAVEDDEVSNAPSRELNFQRDTDRLPSNLRANSGPNTSGVTMAARHYHTLTLTNPPRFGDLPAIPIVQEENDQRPPQSSATQATDSHERAASFPVAPDEKLLDALANPKDRLPLLQLEEKFLGFIATTESEFLDLPPQNSFARLLAHKLADYYSLARGINEDGTSIRVFRTSLLSMPTPLHVLAQSIPAGPSQPSSAMAVKIMRRAGLGPRQGSAGGSTPASSSAPSKATSEAGLETNSEEGILSPAEGTPNKDKSRLTREEREAQYKAVRERIFGDFQESVTSESASTGENSASMSRSSSSSGKKKTRKQKVPKDDGFEARSAFVPSYPPMQVPNMQPQYQPPYSEHVYPGNPYQAPNNGYGASMSYGTTPTPSFPNFEPSMPYNGGMGGYGGAPNNTQHFSPADPWSSMQSPASNGYFNYSASPTGFQQSMSPMMTQMNNQFMQQQPPSGLPQQSQNWMNNQFQPPYPHAPPPHPTNSNMNGWSGYQSSVPPINNTPSYPYGQLPSSQGYSGGNPTTYNSNNSNNNNAQHPVPGSFSRSLFNPQTRSFVPNNAPSRNGGRNGRKKGAQASGQSRITPGLKTYGLDAAAGSNMPTMHGFDKGSSGSTPSAPSSKEDTSLQQKYGAPAHLPKKPPPSQVSVSYDPDNIHGPAPLAPGALGLNGPTNNAGGGAGGPAGASSA